MPPEAMLGFDTADDAAVWRIAPNIAGILTIDFLTPIVDEPYDFGRIAAANALSDVFAMGGVPNVALNVVAMDSTLPEYVPRDMLRGGLEKVIEAGAVIMGGHSIDDEEPKYGLCVFGTVAPRRARAKRRRKAGRYPVPHQAARHGHRERGAQGRHSGRCRVLASRRIDGRAQPRCGRGDGRRRRACRDRRNRLRPCRPPARNALCKRVRREHQLERRANICGNRRSRAPMVPPGAFVFRGRLCAAVFARARQSNGRRCHCRAMRPANVGGMLCAIPSEAAATFEEEFAARCGRTPAKIGRVIEGESGHIHVVE